MMNNPAVENDSEQTLEYLVLDSNAFIRGYGLANLCKKAKCIVTIEEVIQEIRDSKARETLQNLPFELVIRAPSSTDCSDVANFAKSSGDFHSLSKTDLKLVALTKMLEREVSSTQPEDNLKSVLPTTAITNNDHNKDNKDVVPEVPSVEAEKQAVFREKVAIDSSDPSPETEETPVITALASLAVTQPVPPEPVPTTAVSDPIVVQSAILSSTSNQFSNANESRKLQADDDGLGWIDCHNFQERLDDVGFSTVPSKKRSSSKKNNKKSNHPVSQPENKVVRVACFTSDFTMQNVLLQLGLHVLSAEGMLVKTVKKFVLRCNACFTVHTKELSRLFCSRCGSNLLSRVSASVEEGGKLRLHLKKNYKIDTTGMKYSLPAPGKQDRFSGELLLREDQLLTGIWRQKVVKINKDVKSAFGEDVTSDVGLHLNKQDKIVIGLGKGNPNARKGRERRGKKAT